MLRMIRIYFQVIHLIFRSQDVFKNSWNLEVLNYIFGEVLVRFKKEKLIYKKVIKQGKRKDVLIY